LVKTRESFFGIRKKSVVPISEYRIIEYRIYKSTQSGNHS